MAKTVLAKSWRLIENNRTSVYKNFCFVLWSLLLKRKAAQVYIVNFVSDPTLKLKKKKQPAQVAVTVFECRHFN